MQKVNFSRRFCSKLYNLTWHSRSQLTQSDTLTIYNVENKKGLNAAKIISVTPYKGASYSHQGWVLDPNWQTHLVLDDELDEGLVVPDEVNPESPALDGFPVTYIFDITNLEKPVNTGFYKSKVKSVDHNQFVVSLLIAQSKSDQS